MEQSWSFLLSGCGSHAANSDRTCTEEKSQKLAHTNEDVELEEIADPSASREVELLALDSALQEFENKWPDKAALVKLRYFAGLTMQEAAHSLGISTRTAERTWTYAKVWLMQAIRDRT